MSAKNSNKGMPLRGTQALGIKGETMKRDHFLLELLWFVAGPMFLAGGLLSFSGDRLGWRPGEYSEVFYAYPEGAIFAAVVGVALVAIGVVRNRRIAFQNRVAGDA